MGLKNMTLTREDAVLLVKWYEKNKRTLPWRDTGNAYDVWLSEIMLQQTRVEAVREKFIQFRSELPDIASLAACEDDRLMRLWEGLGYYSRARNLKKAAQRIMQDHEGVLPASLNSLLKLPGIGPYTAGAVASIAFGIPSPAVDGNVLRIFARRFGIREDIKDQKTKDMITGMITAYYEDHPECADDPSFVSAFTQGLMELGALVCLPNGDPHCSGCPWQNKCHALHDGTISEIPFRSRNKDRKIINRTLLVIRDGDHFLMRKRPDKGLLAGLYEFPGTDTLLTKDEVLKEVRDMGYDPLRISRLPDAKHIFTHIEWHMQAYEIMTASVRMISDKDLLMNKEELAHRAIPSAFRVYVDYYALRD